MVISWYFSPYIVFEFIVPSCVFISLLIPILLHLVMMKKIVLSTIWVEMARSMIGKWLWLQM